jgi:uncharacterized protein with HEPN domain
MKKDPRVFLDDILESIDRVESYIKGVKKEQFELDIQLYE